MSRFSCRRLGGCTALAVGASALALMASAAPAGAALGYANLCPSLMEPAFCTAGSRFGFGLAIENASGPRQGDMWLAFQNEVLEYGAAGERLAGEINDGDLPESAEPFAHADGGIEGVAVDPADGDVYVSDKKYRNSPTEPQSGTVTKLTAAGAFQFQLNGSSCTGTCPANPAESATPQGAASFAPEYMAVVSDPSSPSYGELYVADLGMA